MRGREELQTDENGLATLRAETEVGAGECRQEVAAVGRPAILIPLPTAADDHQRKNAEALEALGAAQMLLQREATGSELAKRILTLAGDKAARTRMSGAARTLARPDAAKVIVDRALELVGRAR